MTIRQIAIRIALLAVAFLVLAGVLRYAFEAQAPYLASGACLLVILAMAVKHRGLSALV